MRVPLSHTGLDLPMEALQAILDVSERCGSAQGGLGLCPVCTEKVVALARTLLNVERVNGVPH